MLVFQWVAAYYLLEMTGMRECEGKCRAYIGLIECGLRELEFTEERIESMAFLKWLGLTQVNEQVKWIRFIQVSGALFNRPTRKGA